MLKTGVVWLIAENPEAHGVGIRAAEKRRRVFCTFRSVSQTETYQAKADGLLPEMRIVLAHDFEYRGEKICVIRGKRYRVIRPYAGETDGIELTVQPEEGNARGEAGSGAE